MDHEYERAVELVPGVFVAAGEAVSIADEAGEVATWNADEVAEDGFAFTAALGAVALAATAGPEAVRANIADGGKTLARLVLGTELGTELGKSLKLPRGKRSYFTPEQPATPREFEECMTCLDRLRAVVALPFGRLACSSDDNTYDGLNDLVDAALGCTGVGLSDLNYAPVAVEGDLVFFEVDADASDVLDDRVAQGEQDES